MGVFASGLQNPLSVAFDNSGNLYVGQQSVDTIAEYNSSGTLVNTIGPVPVENAGTDWITLADQCTIDYTSESTDILSYNMCTNTPGPNVNAEPFPTNDPVTNQPTNQAYEAQVRPNGQVLVADSSQDILLNTRRDRLADLLVQLLRPYGAGCDDNLFTISLDPNGSTFWTGDSVSGYIWQVDIATGNVLQTINAKSGTVYGLSVADQIEVAAPAPAFHTAVTLTPPVLPSTISPGTPATFTTVLTNSSTGLPVVNESVTFTLSGSPPCTTNTDASGTATCTITPGQQTGPYTLTTTFNGNTTLGSDTVHDPRHDNSGPDGADLHRAHVGGQRPALHALGHPDTRPGQHDPACRLDGHLLHRLGPVLHRDRPGRRHRQLHGRSRLPRRPAPRRSRRASARRRGTRKIRPPLP